MNWAILDADQNVRILNPKRKLLPIPAKVTGKATRHEAWMCPAAQGWQDTFAARIAKIVMGDSADAVKPDGIYMDYITHYAPRPCYDKAHGHVTGGGSYWVKGYRDLIKETRRLAKQANPQLALSSEGFSEPYIEVLDASNISLMTPSPLGPTLPLAMAVYHDYHVFYGSIIVLAQSLQAQVAKQQRALVWGAIPGFHAMPIHDYRVATDLKFLLWEIGGFRRKHRDYLIEGEMLRPPKLRLMTGAAPSAELIEVLSSEQSTEAMPSIVAKGTAMPYPAVLASAWRSGKGKIGVVVAALEATPKAIKFHDCIRDDECLNLKAAYLVKGDGTLNTTSSRAKLTANLDADPQYATVPTRRTYVPLDGVALGLLPGTNFTAKVHKPDGTVALAGTFTVGNTKAGVVLPVKPYERWLIELVP